MPVKKAATPRKATTRAVASDHAVIRPSDDEIRLRAYQLYLQRNGHPGDPMEDWLRAESELTADTVLPTAPPKAARKTTTRQSAS